MVQPQRSHSASTVRARLSQRFGPGVAGWCDDLPALVSSVAGQWGLRPLEVVTAGATSVVVLCSVAGGGQVVLKLTPEVKLAAEEAATAAEAGRGPVAIDPRPCMGDPAFDAVDRMLPGGSEAAVKRRIGWLAGNLVAVDPDRVWAWCQALAVVVAVSTLIRSGPDDPYGQALLRLAGSGSQ